LHPRPCRVSVQHCHRELPAPPRQSGGRAWRSGSPNLTAEIATGGMLLAFLPRNDNFCAEREGAQPLPYGVVFRRGGTPLPPAVFALPYPKPKAQSLPCRTYSLQPEAYPARGGVHQFATSTPKQVRLESSFRVKRKCLLNPASQKTFYTPRAFVRPAHRSARKMVIVTAAREREMKEDYPQGLRHFLKSPLAAVGGRCYTY